MDRKPMNIFLHFLNKDTQEIFGIRVDGNPIVTARIMAGLNAAVLLCDSETYCFLPLGFWFESKYTRTVLLKAKDYIEEGYIRFSTRERDIYEFVQKKRRQYSPFRNGTNAYEDFFDGTILQQLLLLNPILMDRWSRIGESCSLLWRNNHSLLIENRSGDLQDIYRMFTDDTNRAQAAKTICSVATIEEVPFIWKNVHEAIAQLSIRDGRVEEKFRRYFEKNYYQVYLDEYNATNLYGFFLLDHGIDFNLTMPATSVANFTWLQVFLKYLHIDNVLSAPADKIVEIRSSLEWLIIQQLYIKACNGGRRFNENLYYVMQDKANTKDIESAINKISEILNRKKEAILVLSEGKCVEKKIDVLIMVATLEEEKAILDNDRWESKRTAAGHEYFLHTEQLCFALARSNEMGRESGAASTQYYIGELRPRYLAMAGFCAGKKGAVNLGDVIIPNKIYRYGNTAGKQLSEQETLPEMNAYHLFPLWKEEVERFGTGWQDSIHIAKPITYEKQRYLFLEYMYNHEYSVNIQDLKANENLPDITKIIREDMDNGEVYLHGEMISATEEGKKKYQQEFLLGYSKPYQDPNQKASVGVLATGDVVQEWKDVFKMLEKKYDRKTCVLDMEASAIAAVAEYNDIKCLIAKGVGDFASGRKSFDNRYIPYAVFSAYRFLVEFYKKIVNLEQHHCM